MNTTTVTSAWVVTFLPVATFLSGLLGTLAANWISRKSARELETRSRREETMRHLKWAAELAISTDHRKAELGLKELQALYGSHILDETELIFVTAAIESVFIEPEAELESYLPRGDDVVVEVEESPANEDD